MEQTQFEHFYGENSQALLRYALRRLPDAADAADVVADVFAIAWRRRQDIPDGDRARLWLYGVARHTLANHQRGERRRHRLACSLLDAIEHVAPDASVPIVAREERAALTAALALLPPDDRELLTLVAWEELTPAEVAVVLDVAAVTVRVRLHRARKRLRELLAPEAKREEPSGHVPVVGQLPVPARETS